MRRNTVKIVIFVSSLTLMAFTLKAAFKNEKKTELSGEKFEILEKAILIDSLQEESDSEDYKNISDTVEDTISSRDGMIFLVENFILEETQSETVLNSGDSLLKDLKKQDIRWHFTEYVIRKGDNLWNIGRKFGVSHKTIIRANSISNPDQLRPGKSIKVPNKNGIYYTVKKGDTLSEIAVKYKADSARISEFNNIKKDKIFVGSRLFLPDSVEIYSEIRKKTYTQKVKSEITAETNNTAINTTKTKYSNETGKVMKVEFSWPVKEHNRITSGFGMRNHPVYKKQKFHNGIDISANIGTDVTAAADGKVVFTGEKEGYGNLIVIEHNDNYITVYAHLGKIDVKKNETVSKGQFIAFSGASGTVTGPHLHFEIRKYLTPLNPVVFLRK